MVGFILGVGGGFALGGEEEADADFGGVGGGCGLGMSSDDTSM